MILSVSHPDIDPLVVARTGSFPRWLDEIKLLVDGSSLVEVGRMRLEGDEVNARALTALLQLHLPGCRILRVVRAA